jgi:hypothetical protein
VAHTSRPVGTSAPQVEQYMLAPDVTLKVSCRLGEVLSLIRPAPQKDSQIGTP